MAKDTKEKKQEEMTWKDLEVGCVVCKPGSACTYMTGDWRSRRPIWDHEKCIKCGLCYLFCPDACVSQKEGKFQADLRYCKGCGICAQECPTSAIKMVEEEQ